MGTWKFIDVEPPMRLLMPITRPSRSNNGPPESPATITQSVWITLDSERNTRPTRTTGGRLGL